MTIWRPAQSIRVKALGLHWRDGRLLAAEVLDDLGHIKGIRPLGGGVEFGETWRQALKREFLEELGVEITIHGSPHVFENIYHHHGVMGHEILFVANVDFPEGTYDDIEVIKYREDNGTACTARWFDINHRKVNQLFPEGLHKLLSQL